VKSQDPFFAVDVTQLTAKQVLFFLCSEYFIELITVEFPYFATHGSMAFCLQGSA
jgi:hypothetical protein